ncbi:neuropeptide receptor npr-1-like [Mytilus edulis]|uniref:neuropeptide receptor npr-1-like n=1 Tax=Mytilus edulis TaxID=6550 RepID=UPI0039F04D0C
MNSSIQAIFVDHLEILNNDKLVSLIPNIVILAMYLIAGLFGNGLVLYIYTFKLKSKTDDRYFIPFLALMDMIACIIGASFSIAVNTNQLTFRSNLICKLMWTVNKFTSISSGLMLVAIAVQRYIKVCRPFRSVMTINSKRFAIKLIIVISILLVVPSGFLYGVDDEYIENDGINITVYRCTVDSNIDRRYDIGYSVFLLFFCFTGILTISILYFLIMKTIYKQESFWKKKRSNQSMRKTEQKSNQKENEETSQSYKISEMSEHDPQHFESSSDIGEDSQSTHNCNDLNNTTGHTINREQGSSLGKVLRCMIRKYKISVMFIIVTALFAVSYFPRIIIMIIESADINFWQTLTTRQYSFCLFLYRAYLLNNILNPVVYSVFDTSFKKECRSLCIRN